MRTLLTILSLAIALPGSAGAAEDFTGTKEVRLIQGDLGSPKAKTIVITDKAKMEKLVTTIKVGDKPRGLAVSLGTTYYTRGALVTPAGGSTVLCSDSRPAACCY